MRNVFRPASLLLYALALITFFLIGLLLAKFTGAGVHQGLAGGAILLFYGMVSAGIALVFSFIATYNMSLKQIAGLNKILSAILLIVTVVIFIQIRNNLSNHSEEIKITPETQVIE